jgi:3-oxoacyl-[acyl-carrier-protein] synthase-1
VLSDGHPTGDGLRRALQAALLDGEISERDIVFRVSDLNGEQYRGIESMLAASRVYRTHRDDIPVWLPAASVGETGAAAGAFLILLAALGLSQGHAPGPLLMCEASSDSGLRAGCVIRSAARTP